MFIGVAKSVTEYMKLIKVKVSQVFFACCMNRDDQSGSKCVKSNLVKNQNQSQIILNKSQTKFDNKGEKD